MTHRDRLRRRLGRGRRRFARSLTDHYAAVGVILATGAVAATVGVDKDNRALTTFAAFGLGAAASIFATGLSERAQSIREATGTRLELLGRDVIERPAHMLYPDFVVDPGTKSSYQRNLSISLPEELAFSTMNLRFSRHVAKEDMDAVRMMNLFLFSLGVHARHVVIRRDSAFIQQALRGLPGAGSVGLDTDQAQAFLVNAPYSVVVVGLGSNLITQIYATLPDALIRLIGDEDDDEGRYEAVEVLAPPNSRILIDRFLSDGHAGGVGSPSDLTGELERRWGRDVVPLGDPARVTPDSPPPGYRLQSSEQSRNHFGFIVRRTLDPVLERRLLIIGGSGPLGTRTAAQFLLDRWDELTLSLRNHDPAADFVAVVHTRELASPESMSVDLIPARETEPPRLLYVVARSPA